VTITTSPLATPTQAETNTSPLPAPTVAPAGIRFEIDRPVTAKDTVIKGSGLPGTPIEIQDVTRMGVVLGAAVIGEDGRFEISVPPLDAGIRIGISLAEPNDEIWANPALFGPQPLVVPLAGSYLDTVSVMP